MVTLRFFFRNPIPKSKQIPFVYSVKTCSFKNDCHSLVWHIYYEYLARSWGYIFCFVCVCYLYVCAVLCGVRTHHHAPLYRSDWNARRTQWRATQPPCLIILPISHLCAHVLCFRSLNECAHTHTRAQTQQRLPSRHWKANATIRGVELSDVSRQHLGFAFCASTLFARAKTSSECATFAAYALMRDYHLCCGDAVAAAVFGFSPLMIARARPNNAVQKRASTKLLWYILFHILFANRIYKNRTLLNTSSDGIANKKGAKKTEICIQKPRRYSRVSCYDWIIK